MTGCCRACTNKARAVWRRHWQAATGRRPAAGGPRGAAGRLQAGQSDRWAGLYDLAQPQCARPLAVTNSGVPILVALASLLPHGYPTALYRIAIPRPAKGIGQPKRCATARQSNLAPGWRRRPKVMLWFICVEQQQAAPNLCAFVSFAECYSSRACAVAQTVHCDEQLMPARASFSGRTANNHHLPTLPRPDYNFMCKLQSLILHAPCVV